MTFADSSPESMDTSWLELESPRTTSAATPGAAGAAASENESTSRSHMNNAVKGWKRMMIKFAAFRDAREATAMLEEIRSEVKPQAIKSGCPHPLDYYVERENQHAKWGKCEACKTRLWARPLTTAERAAQLQRKAGRQARSSARVQRERDAQAMVRPPFDPPKMSSNPERNANPGNRAASASSASAGTTEVTRLAEVLQGNTEAVAKMAEAIQNLVNRRN